MAGLALGWIFQVTMSHGRVPGQAAQKGQAGKRAGVVCPRYYAVITGYTKKGTYSTQRMLL